MQYLSICYSLLFFLQNLMLNILNFEHYSIFFRYNYDIPLQAKNVSSELVHP